MFPLRDENPTDIRPVVTAGIILLNVLAWFLLQGAGAGEAFRDSLCHYAAIPGQITGDIPSGRTLDFGRYSCRVEGTGWGSLVTSMFMHGGWLHLILNMWFLWVFGNNIEDAMGHLKFALFYLLAGLAAAGAHIASAPGSGVPMVGASGAISGVMGAYLLLYPRHRVVTLVIVVIFIQIIHLPAWVMLGYWFLLELMRAFLTTGGGGGVAFWAHVGGFVAGVATTWLFATRETRGGRGAAAR